MEIFERKGRRLRRRNSIRNSITSSHSGVAVIWVNRSKVRGQGHMLEGHWHGLHSLIATVVVVLVQDLV